MVSAAIVNAALGGNAAGPPRALWLDGDNVLKQLGVSGNGYGVPVDSIEVTEAGPGGVSRMTFTIDDPLKAVTLRRGAEVQFHDLAGGHKDFHGWVQSWSLTPWALGRRYSVRCWGPEKLLDWLIVPSLTLASGTIVRDCFVAILAAGMAAVGIGAPLTTRGKAALGGYAGDAGEEIAAFSNIPFTWAIGYTLTLTNQTVRQAIEQVFRAMNPTGGEGFPWDPAASQTGMLTVDMNLAVRIFRTDVRPADWSDLTVTDTHAGPIRAAGLQHTTDAGDVPAGVYVAGGNAAGSGLVPAGDGRVGPIAVLNDSSILSATARDIAGTNYMAERSGTGALGPTRGEFDLDEHTPAGTVHAGSFVNITDAETGATGTYRIAQIDKRYLGNGLEQWHVTYGGLRPSVARAIRRYTKAVLS